MPAPLLVDTATTCPECRGELVVVGSRAWCVQRYDAGGCGSNYTLRGTRLVRQDQETR